MLHLLQRDHKTILPNSASFHEPMGLFSFKLLHPFYFLNTNILILIGLGLLDYFYVYGC